MDKVGLVTITYNSADVLQPFLDSVWNQTHENLTLYVVDNSSTDTTLDILRNDKDSRLVVSKSETNFGVAKANNQGIKKAIDDGCNQILIINNDVEFETTLIEKLNWNIGPADRIAIVGVNGSGKTTLMRTLAGQYRFSSGKLQTGITVKAAFLSQHLEELNPSWRVLEAVENVALRVDLAGGREISASQLCERLGFDYEGQQKMVRDLSGGEKRRLQLTRLLMASPNVLLLDEPTNDFDIETLTELEDLLDGYGGTLIVISHDRYFLERVCDRFVGLLGDKNVRDLPRGVDEYLKLRHESLQPDVSAPKEKKTSSAAEERQLKKDRVRLERQMEKADSRITELEGEQEGASFDAGRLNEITNELAQLRGEKNRLEEEWLQVTVLLEG